MSTFKGVAKAVEKSKPHVVVLENVDAIDSPTGDEEEKECFPQNS